ncbi:MAG: hypothetical protein RLO50_14860 [Azospirillaceae bacterium]
MPLNLRQVLRQIPQRTLQPYFAGRGLIIDEDVWALGVNKRPRRLLQCLLGLDRDSGREVIADLARVQELAGERGFRAMVSAADGETGIIKTFASLDTFQERALWLLHHHPQLFRNAEQLHFVDHRTEGQQGRHYRTDPGHDISREDANIARFEDAICAYHQRDTGAGISCATEFLERDGEATQISLYVEGLPNHRIEVVDGNFRHLISAPTIAAAIVYDPATGDTTTIGKGGWKVHEALREAFARHLLGVEPKFDTVRQRSFALHRLARRQDLAPDPAFGVEVAWVRRLRLVASDPDQGQMVLESPRGDSSVTVYDLADSWLGRGGRLLGSFEVIHAAICLRFYKEPDATRARTITIELTRPNGSNLKNLSERDREVAETHIAKWGLIADAGE